MPAPLYQETDPWRNVTRERCMRCDKIAYPSEAKAVEAVEKIAERIAMKAYLGGCGHWHLSRQGTVAVSGVAAECPESGAVCPDLAEEKPMRPHPIRRDGWPPGTVFTHWPICPQCLRSVHPALWETHTARHTTPTPEE